MSRPYRLRLFDMLDAIAVCERLTQGRGLSEFAADPIARLAAERALEIVSEASRYLQPDDLAAHPEVPWRQIADFGNALRHGYDRLDAARVHGAATASIADLKPVIAALYQRHKHPSDPWPDATRGESADQ